jgi:hypothetical protein
VPNLLVDVDSQRRSACYPRRTFYPFSDGLSIRNHRITKSCFRTCSTCMSRSQAPLCLYVLPTISIRLEGTFERLRYNLGGDHPSQTAHQTMFSARITGTKLDLQINKGGISRLTPPELTPWLHSLPPILHKSIQKPMSSCSKGARGLSVLSRVAGIFTGTTNSLSISPRQRPTRYAIHAGRNFISVYLTFVRDQTISSSCLKQLGVLSSNISVFLIHSFDTTSQ